MCKEGEAVWKINYLLQPKIRLNYVLKKIDEMLDRKVTAINKERKGCRSVELKALSER